MRAAEQHEFSAIRFALSCVELWWKRHKDNTRPGRTVKSVTPFFHAVLRACRREKEVRISYVPTHELAQTDPIALDSKRLSKS